MDSGKPLPPRPRGGGAVLIRDLSWQQRARQVPVNSVLRMLFLSVTEAEELQQVGRGAVGGRGLACEVFVFAG